MRIFTLPHPYAMAIAIGAKRFHPADRIALAGEYVGIRAHSDFPSFCMELVETDTFFAQALTQAGVTLDVLEKTRGHVIAVSFLSRCLTLREALFELHPVERGMGDYRRGVYTHVLEFSDVTILREPVRCLSTLGLRRAHVEIERRVLTQLGEGTKAIDYREIKI